jgi:hypothetical protein
MLISAASGGDIWVLEIETGSTEALIDEPVV